MLFNSVQFASPDFEELDSIFGSVFLLHVPQNISTHIQCTMTHIFP
jgi:hypothetical protein